MVILVLLRASKSADVHQMSTAVKQRFFTEKRWTSYLMFHLFFRSTTSLDRFTNEINPVAEIIPTFHHEITIWKPQVLKHKALITWNIQQILKFN